MSELSPYGERRPIDIPSPPPSMGIPKEIVRDPEYPDLTTAPPDRGRHVYPGLAPRMTSSGTNPEQPPSPAAANVAAEDNSPDLPDTIDKPSANIGTVPPRPERMAEAVVDETAPEAITTADDGGDAQAAPDTAEIADAPPLSRGHELADEPVVVEWYQMYVEGPGVELTIGGSEVASVMGTFMEEDVPHGFQFGPMKVDPEYRQAGLATRLMGALVATAAAHGAETVYGSVESEHVLQAVSHAVDEAAITYSDMDPILDEKRRLPMTTDQAIASLTRAKEYKEDPLNPGIGVNIDITTIDPSILETPVVMNAPRPVPWDETVVDVIETATPDETPYLSRGHELADMPVSATWGQDPGENPHIKVTLGGPDVAWFSGEFTDYDMPNGVQLGPLRVHGEYREAGVATRLVSALAAVAIANGAETLYGFVESQHSLRILRRIADETAISYHSSDPVTGEPITSTEQAIRALERAEEQETDPEYRDMGILVRVDTAGIRREALETPTYLNNRPQ